MVIGCSILIFLFSSTTWTIHQRPPRLRRLYTTDNFSCSYSSRRGREKERERSWPSIRNFLRVFRCVPRSVWQVQSCVIYIYIRKRERERRDSYFSSLLISIRFYFSMSCLKRVCCLSYLEIERKRRKNKEELETCCRVSEHTSERDVCCPYPSSFPVQFINPTNIKDDLRARAPVISLDRDRSTATTRCGRK